MKLVDVNMYVSNFHARTSSLPECTVSEDVHVAVDEIFGSYAQEGYIS